MKDFNGGYIKASQEAMNLLILNGNQPFEWNEAHKYKFYSIYKNLIHGHTNGVMIEGLKQFYINNGALSWDELKDGYAEAREIIRLNGLDTSDITEPLQINSMEDLNELPLAGEVMETISIKDNNGKEYVFDKPEFECELLKVVDNGKSIRIVGYVIDSMDSIFSGHWDIEGHFFSGRANYKDFNLKPIRAKWYEDEDNFPALMYDNNLKEFVSIDYKHQLNDSDLRLATKSELNSLYHKDKH